MSKPITLYSHPGVRSRYQTNHLAKELTRDHQGPNPWKVAIILEELGLKYDTKIMDFTELKKDPFEKINPNGRVPAIEDPNTGINLWESGAIIEYLLETYDTENKLSYTKAPEKFQQLQWLHFQMSGQGEQHPGRSSMCLLGVIDSFRTLLRPKSLVRALPSGKAPGLSRSLWQ